MIESSKPKKHPRLPNKQRVKLKKFWSNGCCHWSDEEFKERLRIKRESFEYILASIRPMILKQPAIMLADHIEDHRQLALAIYRLAHGCSFKVLKDLFGVSQSVATETFNQVIRVIVSCLYNEFVYFHGQMKNGKLNANHLLKITSSRASVHGMVSTYMSPLN